MEAYYYVCFFIRHYIALIASSNSEADQLKWYGHVESKLRFLIISLERNQHIQLSHIWPKSYQPVNPQPNRHTTQWFIGLEFAKCGSLNVDLTSDIHNFTAQGNWQWNKFYY